jgi:hypothetical protein
MSVESTNAISYFEPGPQEPYRGTILKRPVEQMQKNSWEPGSQMQFLTLNLVPRNLIETHFWNKL